jgi:pyruvyltransferase
VIVRTYWCASCWPNFGDRLGPELLASFGIRAVWAAPAEAELVTVGSVLGKLPDRWRGTVLGTGLIEARLRRKLRTARVLAVRGVLTRDACDLPAKTPLGDPGILAPRLVPGLERTPDGPVVIVPHRIDRAMRRRHPNARVVDILGPTPEILREVAAASLVYTSSLHGLIAADALGVPHVLELAETIGGIHKFRDYASAFGDSIEPGLVRLTDRDAMRERQAAIAGLFEGLAA